MVDAISKYLKEVWKALASGDATEHTHRPALKALIESLDSKVTATNEPKKRTDCGAPDIKVSLKKGSLTIGYVEAKDVGKSLDDEERSDQLQRYRRCLGNLILTDYLEFRWFVEGERRLAARLGHVGKGGKIIRDREGEDAVLNLLENFILHQPEKISKPKELAEHMARLTHMIRDIIIRAFEREDASSTLKGLRGAFAKVLIPDMERPEKTEEFADMFAQTIAYGLFAARCNHVGPGPFQRLGAAAEIPRTNPFLRKLFDDITGVDMNDEPFVGFVDDLVRLLAHADIGEILRDFGQRERERDPVIHFYETFLAAYNPETRERRGVYYTPEPVVSYIVRSVDQILKARFGLPDGLADKSTVTYERSVEKGGKLLKEKNKAPKVLILDPACGTGTFLYAVVDLIRERLRDRKDAGMWSGYVKGHLLPRLFGFELLMAPYAVAHFKLGMQLAAQDMTEAQRKTWACDFSGDERLGIYLTNTLEEAVKKSEILFGKFISDEANAAVKVKRDLPIMVILGNPPYSANSANKGKWMTDLVRSSYYPKDNIKERNPKLLLDDYVKFIRWAQWRIERTGAGVLAFITNHGYLDNPTFRGMRQHLMKTFDEIYIVNLHGNVRKREKAPDGSKDENVFDIRQGVAIAIMIKTGQRQVRASALFPLPTCGGGSGWGQRADT